MIRFIESRQNPLIKEALRIKERKEKDLLLIEGEHAIEMACTSRFGIKRVFFSRNYKNLAFLRRLAKVAEIIETTERLISLLSDTEHPQGIVAVVTYESPPLDILSLRESPLLVICDGIQDPGNLGTIIRTSDAAGADAVIILSGTCDPFMQKVIRASAGSIFNIPLVFSGWEHLEGWLSSRDIRLIVTVPSAEKRIYEIDLRNPVALAFGNEARGVSGELLKRADVVAGIPILGRAESLNVAVAASICLYEAVRQRLYLKVPGRS